VRLEVGGASYRVGPGEERSIPAPAVTGDYEVQAGPYRQTWTLQAGKTYTIRPPSP
jgi:hypothetical protein